jgi:NAD(P)-dependent dehydrogenase (short-subunit alcohol dehydrogenase family)
MKICLADLSEEALDRATKQLSGTTVVTVPTDVSRWEDVQRLKDRAYAAFGEVAILMNRCAAYSPIPRSAPFTAAFVTL